MNENNNGTGFNDGNLFFSIPKLCFKAKSESYIIESEWRLCKNEFNEENIKFNVKGNLIVPFIEHYFDKNIIKEIFIGPSANSEQVERALKIFLSKFGYENLSKSIKRSTISYRSV